MEELGLSASPFPIPSPPPPSRTLSSENSMGHLKPGAHHAEAEGEHACLRDALRRIVTINDAARLRWRAGATRGRQVGICGRGGGSRRRVRREKRELSKTHTLTHSIQSMTRAHTQPWIRQCHAPAPPTPTTLQAHLPLCFRQQPPPPPPPSPAADTTTAATRANAAPLPSHPRALNSHPTPTQLTQPPPN